MTRQERRHAARGQRTRTHPKTNPTGQHARGDGSRAGAADAGSPLAEFVPTHPADYRPGVSKVRLASGRFIDRLDMSAWHEAGHAVAFLALGWSIRYLSVARPAAGLADPIYATPDWWAGECRADPPPMPDRDHERRQYHAMAVATMAGPVAARAVRIDLGFQTRRDEELHTETLNAEGDGLTLTLAQTVLGIAPDDAAAFERDVREEATAILIAHRRVYGALVAALLTHQLLNAAEVAAVWQRGAFDFRGPDRAPGGGGAARGPHPRPGSEPAALPDSGAGRLYGVRAELGRFWNGRLAALRGPSAKSFSPPGFSLVSLHGHKPRGPRPAWGAPELRG